MNSSLSRSCSARSGCGAARSGPPGPRTFRQMGWHHETATDRRNHPGCRLQPAGYRLDQLFPPGRPVRAV